MRASSRWASEGAASWLAEKRCKEGEMARRTRTRTMITIILNSILYACYSTLYLTPRTVHMISIGSMPAT